MNAQTINEILNSLARLVAENRQEIIGANKLDIDACPVDDAVIFDRLKVDQAKIDKMIASIKSVIDAPDPVGKVISSHTCADGLKIENKKVPFGTILIIYEARPDVSIEAAIIALKASNKTLLKGGKEARNTNLYLADLWQKALEENDADPDFVKYLDYSREQTRHLICGESEKFDLVIPRGGDSLINFVVKNSKAPVIVSGRGNNFAYVDAEADFEMAVKIILDGKQRLSVCNALDKVLINAKIPDFEKKLELLMTALHDKKIEIFGDRTICQISTQFVQPIEVENIWAEEFLSAKIVIGTVADVQEAVEKINRYSGGHSAVIVTKNKEAAERFLTEVDCAAVYHNASTRFTDGGEFGLGAEIAISTQKLHFRGPLGAEHLLTNKWFVRGEGQIRN